MRSAVLGDMCKAKSRKGTHKRRDSQGYWESRLDAMNLSMNRGSKLGQEDIIYGQDIVDLDFFASQEDKSYVLSETHGERLE